jgi:NDP-sugar pyrophosphorylase family protein
MQLACLRKLGFDQVILSLGYMASKVQDALGLMDLRGMSVHSVAEVTPLGTGGAIRHALEKSHCNEVIVANGDTFLDADVEMMSCPLAVADGELARMALVRVGNRSRFGGVALEQSNRVAGFHEKGDSSPGLINAGFYRLHVDAFRGFDTTPCSLETEIFPQLVKRRVLWAAIVAGTFTDIGVPEDYHRFCAQHES